MLENEIFKVCCIQKHEVQWPLSTGLERGLLNCSTDVYVTLNGDLAGVHYRYSTPEAFVHIYACSMGQRAVSLTYLSILKEGFTPICSATLSYGKAFHHKKTGVTFPICLGKRSVLNFSHSVNMAATLNITLWKC